MAYIETINGNPLAVDSFVTPEQFGAVGDGVADDTAAIQAAIDSGSKVVLAEKTYRIGTLRMPSSASVEGVGWKSSLLYDGNDAAISIEYAYNVKMRNLSIRSAGYVQSPFTTGGIGIRLTHPITTGHDNTWSSSFENVSIVGFDYGVYIPKVRGASNDNYCSETLLLSCKIFECKVGFYCDNAQAVNNNFISCQIERNNSAARTEEPLIEMYGGLASFTGCSLIGAGSIAVTRKRQGDSALMVPHLNFSDCRAELHPPLNATKRYLFDSNLHSTNNSTSIFNISNFALYVFPTTDTVYLVHNDSRCLIDIENVNVTKGGGGNVSFAWIDAAQGYTGYLSTPYSWIYGRNINGLTADIHIEGEGAAQYCTGVIQLQAGNTARNAYIYQGSYARDVNGKIVVSGTSAGARLSTAYFTMPERTCITKFGIVVTDIGSYNATTMELYKVKDKASWADPSATNPSSSDMVLIASIEKGANLNGAYEVALTHASGREQNLVGQDGYKERRYLIKKSDSSSNGPTGFAYIEYI